MDDLIMQISIPADIDGFVLLQCPLCGEFFKLKADEMQADDVIVIWCPCCGLKGDNYLTNDVIELAMIMASNKLKGLVYEEFKKLERKNKCDSISYKAGKKPKEVKETPIMQGIHALDYQDYNCCKKQARIKQIIKIVGSYCPYCGVRYDEN
ncbi:MAG: TFIIB-type zinc ribbon-containing protein [Bacillota bacterium]|nr:TFIIB-type zinc ribbon-containing protein [Bacillota bacterium]